MGIWQPLSSGWNRGISRTEMKLEIVENTDKEELTKAQKEVIRSCPETSTKKHNLLPLLVCPKKILYLVDLRVIQKSHLDTKGTCSKRALSFSLSSTSSTTLLHHLPEFQKEMFHLI
jgi:hypothetical protein